MKRKIFFFLIAIQSLILFANEDERIPKLLVLIVATDADPLYVEGQKIWRSYMHSDPEHIESYFIKSNPDLPVAYMIEGDTIWCKTPDTLDCMLNRTLLTYECLSDRIREFDYILRTSTTTVYIFPRLLQFLKTLPKEKCFAGPQHRCGDYGGGDDIHWGGFFYGGPGFILSPDLVEFQLKNKHILCNNSYYFDDALLACFLLHNQIPMIPTIMMQFPNLYWWWVHEDVLPENVFHFRVDRFVNSQHKRTSDEIYILSEIVKKFYNVTFPLEVDKVNYDLQKMLFYSQVRPWKIWQTDVFHDLLDTVNK